MNDRHQIEPARNSGRGTTIDLTSATSGFQSAGETLARDEETRNVFKSTGWGAAFGALFGPYGVLAGATLGWLHGMGKEEERRRNQF